MFNHTTSSTFREVRYDFNPLLAFKVALFICNWCCICFIHWDGQSPLWTASYHGHLEVVENLIDAGANVNQARKVGVASVLS